MSRELLQVLYQDERYVAVHKPAGMLVHKTAMDREDKVFCLQVLRDQLGRHVFPCHRLDKPTSGVLLFALDREAHRAASGLFEDKAVRKTYNALVRGWLAGEGSVEHPLRRISESGHRSTDEGRQPAVTNWRGLDCYEVKEPVGRFPTARYALVELIPGTGRTHQLRRHMKHLNHHIIGDTRYGDGVHNRFFRERFNCHRLMLLARQLDFRHPFTGEAIRVTSGSDPGFEGVLEDIAGSSV